MAQNLVVQLLLKTGTFSTDLKTAKGQIQNFQKGCNTASKSLTAFGQGLGINVGTLAKFGGAVGAAVVAGKSFKAILDSSQTSSDAFEGAIAGCKGVIDSFTTAIATADFSAFKNGLWEVFDAAKAVQEALDQLGNTQIAYDYKTKQNMTKFQEAYNVFKDPEATTQMKEDAKNQMKEAVDAQFQYARTYSNSLYKTYVAQVVKKAGSNNLKPNNVTMAQFERAMNIDLGVEGDPEKVRQSIESQYKSYLAQLKEYGKNNLTAQEDLKKRYRDVIAIHAMLELMKDDELKGVAQLLGGMEDAKQAALSMEKTMNRAISSKTKTSTKSSTKEDKEQLQIEEGSLTFYENLLREKTAARDATVKDTEEWKKLNQEVLLYEQKIKDIKGLQEETNELVMFSVNWYKKGLAVAEERLNNLEIGSEEYIKQRREIELIKKALDYVENQYVINEAMRIDPPTIESLETILSYLRTLQRTLPVTSDAFKEVSAQISEFESKLNNLRGVNTPDLKTNKSQWSEYASTLSQVSNIASSLTSVLMDLTGAERDSASGWNAFMKGISTGVAVFQLMANVIDMVSKLTVTNASQQAAAAAEVATANTAEATAVVAAKQAEAAAAGGDAAAKGADAVAGIPIIGPALAVAAAASIAAAIIAAMASAKSAASGLKFANGGIVGGSSFTGDRVSANVNSGEMILNGAQQARLFRMANGSSEGRSQVEFHISGTDLVGVLNNQNRKNRIIR